MKLTRFPLLALFALSTSATAAPFLVCDTYPTTSAQAMPTEFVVTISGAAQPIVSPAEAVQGGVRLHLDLGPLNLTGARTVTAKARNQWGESANSAPFSFTAGSPAPPGTIGLSAN